MTTVWQCQSPYTPHLRCHQLGDDGVIRFVPAEASVIAESALSMCAPSPRAVRKFRNIISYANSGQFDLLIRRSHLLGGSFLPYRSRKMLKRDIASSAWYR